MATEVVGRVSDFGIKELKLKRIQGLVRIENITAVRVLEKNGYIKEGLLHYYSFGHKFHDVNIMAIISKIIKENNY